MDEIKQLQKMIDEMNNIVFFGGAGVSTDSGIRDYRGKNGLYRTKYKYPVEYMLSSNMFFQHNQEFYEFYKSNFNCLNAEPNITHKYLKKLEDQHKLKAIVTQNIDGLHRKAGSKNVLEIHGTIYHNHCVQCGKEYSAEEVFQSEKSFRCICGGMIKPDVVLYGEMLPDSYILAQEYIEKADMLIVAGTSLTVEPASSLVRLFHGKYLVILNNESTPYDKMADLVIYKPLKEIFSKLK